MEDNMIFATCKIMWTKQTDWMIPISAGNVDHVRKETPSPNYLHTLHHFSEVPSWVGRVILEQRYLFNFYLVSVLISVKSWCPLLQSCCFINIHGSRLTFQILQEWQLKWNRLIFRSRQIRFSIEFHCSGFGKQILPLGFLSADMLLKLPLYASCELLLKNGGQD